MSYQRKRSNSKSSQTINQIETPLTAAVLSGSIKQVKKILNKSNINTRNKDGHTALMIATMLRCRTITEHLLASGADISLNDPDGLCFFHMLFFDEKNEEKMLDTFLTDETRFKQILSPTLLDHEGQHPIHYAIDEDDYISWADKMLKHNHDLVYLKNLKGQSLGVFATQHNAYAFLETLKLHLTPTEWQSELLNILASGLKPLDEEAVQWVLSQPEFDFNSLKQLQIKTLVHSSIKTFLINVMNERPSAVHAITNDSFLLELCLANGIYDANQIIDDEPLFHRWEKLIYQQYANTSAFEKEYPIKLAVFVKKYNPNLNLVDQNNLNLLAKLAADKTHGLLRIESLTKRIQGFSLTNLDDKNSSLLHLACLHDNIPVISWAIQQNLNVMEKRADQQTPLSIVTASASPAALHIVFLKLSPQEKITYLKEIQAEETINLFIDHHFFGWHPTRDAKKTLKNHHEKWHAHFFPHKNKQQNNALMENISTSDEQNLKPKPLTWDGFKDLIEQKNVTKIKHCKQFKLQSELQELLEANVDEFIDILIRTSHACAYQLLRMPAVQKTIGPMYLDILQRINQERSDMIPLFLQQVKLTAFHKNFGFDWLINALKKKNIPLFLELLQHTHITNNISPREHELFSQAMEIDVTCALALIKISNVQKTLHENGNAMLMQAIRLGKFEMVDALLRNEEVIKLSAINHNAALKSAVEHDDQDSCLALLQLTPVIEALANNNYEFVRNAIEDEDHILLEMMNQIPHVNEFIQKFYSQDNNTTNAQTIVVAASPSLYTQESAHTTTYPTYCYPQQAYQQTITYYPQQAYQQVAYPSIYYANADYSTQPTTSALCNEIYTTKYDMTLMQYSDAILYEDQNQLTRLLQADAKQTDTGFIMYLLGFALRHERYESMNHILKYTNSMILGRPDYCNELLLQALEFKKSAIFIKLINKPQIHSSAHLFNNRLLHRAIHLKQVTIAQSLLKNPHVSSEAAYQNNYAIRWACQLGLTPIVDILLMNPAVQKNLDVFKFAPLRKATICGHEKIILRLLKEPKVREYAKKYPETYQCYLNQLVSLSTVKQRDRLFNNRLSPNSQQSLREIIDRSPLSSLTATTSVESLSPSPSSLKT